MGIADHKSSQCPRNSQFSRNGQSAFDLFFRESDHSVVHVCSFHAVALPRQTFSTCLLALRLPLSAGRKTKLRQQQQQSERVHSLFVKKKWFTSPARRSHHSILNPFGTCCFGHNYLKHLNHLNHVIIHTLRPSPIIDTFVVSISNGQGAPSRWGCCTASTSICSRGSLLARPPHPWQDGHPHELTIM